jgi:hypothetical protein
MGKMFIVLLVRPSATTSSRTAEDTESVLHGHTEVQVVRRPLSSDMRHVARGCLDGVCALFLLATMVSAFCALALTPSPRFLSVLVTRDFTHEDWLWRDDHDGSSLESH